jgi:hypothetical protein
MMLGQLVVIFFSVLVLVPAWQSGPLADEFTRLPGEHFIVGRPAYVVRRIRGEIRARIRSAEPSVPLPFAVVELFGPGTDGSLRRLYSDLGGRFELAGETLEGEYRYKVLHLSFHPVEGKIEVSRSASDPGIEWELTPARFFEGDLRGFTQSPSEHIINELDEELIMPEVRGRVVGNGGPSGWPMAGVLVEIMGPDGSEALRAAVSDAQGLFQVADVPAGRYRWKATAFGFQSAIGSLLVRPGIEAAKEWEIILYVGV